MSPQEDEFVVVFCAAGPGQAEAIARALVEERLAACVNISQVALMLHLGGQAELRR